MKTKATFYSAFDRYTVSFFNIEATVFRLSVFFLFYFAFVFFTLQLIYRVYKLFLNVCRLTTI